jgi:prepilin-type N-terminal cleavage/methylation domain-containing protein
VGAAARGFTLIELMVVMVIASLLIQLAVVNVGAMIPGAKIEAEANKLRSVLSYVRSEAMLQGRLYRIRFDMDRNRYQVILPPDLSQFSTEAIEEGLRTLDWVELDRDVRLVGFQIGGNLPFRREYQEVVFDALGFTADTSISIQHRNDKELVYTVQIPGLSGDIKVVGGKGVEVPLPVAKEADF